MPCIVAPLKTDNIVYLPGKEIGNLSFALVAPLGAYYNGDFRSAVSQRNGGCWWAFGKWIKS